MALADSQKISRVLTGKPFGDGKDGAYSSATIPTMTVEGCSGSAAGTTLTADGTTISDGDVVLIHQSRGTGAGQWEINKVASGGGSVNLVMKENLVYTYINSGASQAQITKIPQYTTVTVQAGTWNVSSWNGDQGGILVFAANEATTVTGTINGAGGNGSAGTPSGAGGTGAGFRGGQGMNSAISYSGEGTLGAQRQNTAANGNGGGSAPNSGDQQKGGAGGNAAAGGAGDGAGGAAAGNATLTNMVFGGGGAGSKKPSVNTTGGGGCGGGIIAIFTKDITVTGSITTKGGNGGVDSHGGAGGAAGGSTLIECETATLGTAKITSAAGIGGTGDNGAGPTGSVGRIAVHHSGDITGTTSPTFSDTTDDSLVESTAGGAFLLSQFV